MATHSSPSQDDDIPSTLLRKEIERLLPLAKKKQRATVAIGQQKSELAVFLFEAQRTRAFERWKVDSLGEFVSAKGLGRDTFAKYKDAGKALLEEHPNIYRSFINAVIKREPRPVLPSVSKLKFMRSFSKRAVAQDASAMADLAGAKRAPLRMLREVTNELSYGGADDEGARTLHELDAFLVHARRTARLVKALQDGEAGDVPRQQAAVRFAALEEQCARLLKLARLGY